MAEVQTTDQSGETTQRFIEFVMMQAQQAAFYLGQIPNPATGEKEVHLDVAKMFIDQLTMIRAKTRGNLTNDEQGVLNNAISGLQMGFVEATEQQGGSTPAPEKSAESSAPNEPEKAAPEAAGAPSSIESSASETESKKKFTKSYGA